MFADLRKTTIVMITKWSRSAFATQPGSDHAGDIAAALLGGRRDAGYRFTIGCCDRDRVAYREDLRMPGNAEIGLNNDTVIPIGRDAEPLGSG